MAATQSGRDRLYNTLTKAITGTHVALYRRTGGGFGGRMAGMPVLLLTTTGRKSGKRRTTPLGYLEDGPTYVIIASNGGRDKPPAWYLNLRSNPQARIQVGRQSLNVAAETADPEEKRRLWAELISRAPTYGRYQQRTTRDIPMVVLRPASTS
jgi:deazaflavin-dependent oxidoreductase (nitroreductase family)